METRARYILVGSFVVLLLFTLAIVALWLARVELKERVSIYDIYFPGSVSGLSEGTAVRDNGISVGRVSEIKLDPQDPTRVRVTVEIDAAAMIKTDSVASLELQGLTGGAFVNITGGSREAAPVLREPGQRYPVIASAPSRLQKVVTSAPEALERLIAVADQLSDILNDKNRQAIADMLESLRRLTAAAASHTGEIDGAISDGAAALRDLRNSVETVNAILVSLNQTIAPHGDLAATIRSVTETSRKFAELAQHLDTMLDENRPQFREFTRGGFEQLQQLTTQAQQLVTQLGRIADTIERDPSQILYGDRRQGYQPK